MFCSNLIHARGYFYKQLGHEIKIGHSIVLKEEWLKTQKPTIRYDISVPESKYINNVLECFDYKIEPLRTLSCYNGFGKNILSYHLKNPPNGLIGVYLKSRNNIFSEEYLSGDYLFSLEEILQNSLSISEIFLFWNKSINLKKREPIIHFIEMDFYENEEEKIKSFVNNFLMERKIISKPIFVKSNCYNIASQKGIISPLPVNSFLGDKKINIVYFDEGIRILEYIYSSINDLLNLSNEAKNIYLFYLKKKIPLEPPVYISHRMAKPESYIFYD
ncbi:hypothetical protein LFWB_4400 [Candidatus Phytoplasma luffae]|uniref:Uncharacterized protein n=1 Tax=Loofah witches'-broom phytoplasma TaxID=35773 RepID=A0A975FI93_LOWBP|nr:hypothetical protein [Candidatus Phytoplasma luffae]QTX02895.1 hypothetical protein LFWB_3250 [Candidatus Phytoplasma luffae]QTX03006.1 hypothetical protein LFWB_4400 [Candidatus Phytoplasma luffae]